jgi:hypothetical protein
MILLPIRILGNPFDNASLYAWFFPIPKMSASWRGLKNKGMQSTSKNIMETSFFIMIPPRQGLKITSKTMQQSKFLLRCIVLTKESFLWSKSLLIQA